MAIAKPLHPGKILKDVLFGEESPFTNIGQVAKQLDIHRVTLSRLLNGHSSITPEMASRLAKLLNTSVDMWLGIQMDYDAHNAKRMMKKLNIKPLAA